LLFEKKLIILIDWIFWRWDKTISWIERTTLGLRRGRRQGKVVPSHLLKPNSAVFSLDKAKR
jgi:hypothetical protein